MPAAGQEALAAFFGLAQGKESNHIASIGVENLLVGRVRRRSNLMRVNLLAEVLDVRENDISWLPVVLVILAATDGGDVRCNAGVDYDVLLASVLIDWYALDDFETVA